MCALIRCLLASELNLRVVLAPTPPARVRCADLATGLVSILCGKLGDSSSTLQDAAEIASILLHAVVPSNHSAQQQQQQQLPAQLRTLQDVFTPLMEARLWCRLLLVHRTGDAALVEPLLRVLALLMDNLQRSQSGGTAAASSTLAKPLSVASIDDLIGSGVRARLRDALGLLCLTHDNEIVQLHAAELLLAVGE